MLPGKSHGRRSLVSSCSLFDKVNKNDTTIDNSGGEENNGAINPEVPEEPSNEWIEAEIPGKQNGVIYYEDGKAYVNFGKYPQTVVDDESLIRELEKISKTNSLGYIEYKGKEYKKQTASIYKSKYKNDELVTEKENYYFENGSIVEDGKIYYFKVEPIKWIVLEEQNGTYKLLSEKIIENRIFNIITYDRKINDKTIYSNNYNYSSLKAWLNGYNGTSYNIEDYTNKGFIDIVFKQDDKDKISSVNDKVGLLNYEDVLNSLYGFDEDESRCSKVTDYAICCGCMISTETKTFGNGMWWLSTPDFRSVYMPGYGVYFDYSKVYAVYMDGDLTSINYSFKENSPHVADKGVGVRPTIEVNLTN